MKSPGWSQRLRSKRKRLLEKFWVRLIANTVYGLGHDSAGDMAASIAYYALLSLFPLLLGVIALLSIFLPSDVVQRDLLAFFSRHLPTSVDALTENISGIVKLRSTLGILSLIGLFWSGSAIFSVIERVVNRVWNIHQYRPYFIRKLRDLILAVGTSVLFFLSLGLTAVTLLLPTMSFPAGQTLTIIISQLLASLLIFSMFLLIYKFMPDSRMRWRDVFPGALLAAVLLEVVHGSFSIYLTRFANYALVYGSIASIIVFVIWIYLSAFILVLGAEFSSEYAKMKHK